MLEKQFIQQVTCRTLFSGRGNTRFTNGGNGRRQVEGVLLDRVSEKNVRSNSIKTLYNHKAGFHFCFFIIHDTFSTYRQ